MGPPRAAEADDEVVIGHDIGIAATHPGDGGAEAALQIQVAQPGACQRPVGDRDAAEVERRAIEREMPVAALTRPVDELVHIVGGTDDHAQIARYQAHVGGCQLDSTIVLVPREGQTGVVPVAQVAEHRQIGARHQHRRTGGGARRRMRRRAGSLRRVGGPALRTPHRPSATARRRTRPNARPP